MNTKKLVFTGISALAMTLSPIASSVAPVTPVFAKSVAPATMATPNGVADFGEGNASITIKGNSSQTLVGKNSMFINYSKQKTLRIMNQSTIHGIKTTRQLYRL